MGLLILIWSGVGGINWGCSEGSLVTESGLAAGVTKPLEGSPDSEAWILPELVERRSVQNNECKVKV
jgi:hypothetical protein